MSHSSQPPSPYDRQYNFTDFQTANPTTPLPGQKVDQELNAVRSTLNATVSRLGEIQADDGHIRNSALNIHAIAESVEDLLTEAPVQAVNAAGASQVAAVNTAGTTQVSNVNAAAASGVASITAATSTPTAVTILSAEASAVSAANTATTAATLATTQANNVTLVYQQTVVALNDAQNAEMAAEGFANAASNAQAAASSQAGNAINAQNLAQGYAADALASKMAALDAKGDAEAAAMQAQSIVDNGAAAITAEVQPYLDEAAASATSAHNSANDALTSKTQAAASASNASSSASNAAASASNASSSASSAAASATAAANSAAAINPANFAPAVHTHGIADVTGLQTALDLKVGDAPSDGNQYARKNGAWDVVAAGGGSYPAQALTASQVNAVADASYRDYGQTATATVTLPSGSLVFTDTDSASADGKPIYFYDASNFNVIDNGTSWTIELPTSVGGSGGYYAEDLVSYLDTLSLSLTATWSGPSMTESLDQLPLLSLNVGYVIAAPQVPLNPGDEVMLRGYLNSYLKEWGNSAAAVDNAVPTYSAGGNFVVWGKPWTLEGYATTNQLMDYANVGQQNTWLSRQTFSASTASGAGIRINPGVAPTSPVNGDLWTNTTSLFMRLNGVTESFAMLSGATFSGQVVTPASVAARASIRIPAGVAPTAPGGGDVWTTTTAMFVRINTSTRTVVMLENANVHSAGQKNTFANTSSTAGLNISPQSSGVSAPVNGDVYYDNSTASIGQIIGYSNSMRGAMTAVRAFSQIAITAGTPAQSSYFGVSSLTDNGVGDFTMNFPLNMADTNFGVVGSTSGNSGADGSVVVVSRAVGSVRVNTIWNGALADVANFTVVVIR